MSVGDHRADSLARDKDRSMEDAGQGILAYLMAGIILYGGLGWLGDHFFRTRFLLPSGLILGVILSLYLVYKRYGVEDAERSDAKGVAPQREESE